MAIGSSEAAASYAGVQRLAGKGGMEPRQGADSFAALLGETVREAAAVPRVAEAVSARAVVGQAEITELVTAVTAAETTVQTMVAVRDRVIQAYQEIIRMPM